MRSRANRLASSTTGHDFLRGLGVTLIAANAPEHFLEDTPTATLIRQVLGAIAQFEKANLVAKLKAARDRKKAKTGKGEGRHSMLERNPLVVQAAKRLADERPMRSLREIAAALGGLGHVAKSGKPFSTSVVKRMLAVYGPAVERGTVAYEERAKC
jgi:DNA invertase Pin-like site-specific DNA recombinase